MTTEDSIPRADDLTYSGKSGIHGQGLFARRELNAGCRVIEYVGNRISKRESLEQCAASNDFIFALDAQCDLDGKVPWNLARLINHSCEPNSEARLIDGRIWIVAVRTISPGEEITFNYSYDFDNYRDHPCRCGAESCVGYMVAVELFPLLRTKGSSA